MKILITGASGFIGSALTGYLLNRGLQVRCCIRSAEKALRQISGLEYCIVGNIDGSTQWDHALKGIDAIVHLAARVHVMEESATGSLSEYRIVNTYGTQRLSEAASANNIRKFIFLSTIKVNGEYTGNNHFCETDAPSPAGAYAVTKWEAEQHLLKLAAENKLDTVIIRPPLVYGAGVGGNFLRLMRWIDKGYYIPSAFLRNKRSLIYVNNLADFIWHCLKEVRGTETFVVSDGRDLSTFELSNLLARSLGRKLRILPIPYFLMRVVAALVNKREQIEKLCGSLRINNTKANKRFGWNAPYSVEGGIKETVAWFSGTKGSIN